MKLHHLESRRAELATVNEWLAKKAGYSISENAGLAELAAAKQRLAESVAPLSNRQDSARNPDYIERVLAEKAIDLIIDKKIAEAAGGNDDAGAEQEETSNDSA